MFLNNSQSQRLAHTDLFTCELTSNVRTEDHRVIEANGGVEKFRKQTGKVVFGFAQGKSSQIALAERNPFCRSKGTFPVIDRHVGASFSVILLLQLVQLQVTELALLSLAGAVFIFECHTVLVPR